MNAITVKDIHELVQGIVLSWNKRDIAGLCSAYAKGAVVVHPCGTFTGLEEIENLYYTICADAERMGYMDIHVAVAEYLESLDDGTPSARIGVVCRILHSSLEQVVGSFACLVVVKKNDRLLIVRDTEVFEMTPA